MDWLDPRTLAIQQLNRLQNINDLLLADAAHIYKRIARYFLEHLN